MNSATPKPITELLAAVGRGDGAAREKLWALIYEELHRLAHCELGGHNPLRNPHPTSLVHEAYFRLTANEPVEWANRRHFFAAAAKAMRCIRIDDVRKRNRLKRGGGRQPAPLGEAPPGLNQDPAELLAVDEALNKLEEKDPRKAEIVMFRYFAGLTRDETAAALEVSPRTVDNEWRLARAWLYRELS